MPRCSLSDASAERVSDLLSRLEELRDNPECVRGPRCACASVHTRKHVCVRVQMRRGAHPPGERGRGGAVCGCMAQHSVIRM